jgi:4-hydroxy-3-methylbut-2-enyl diphosphate reductase
LAARFTESTVVTGATVCYASRNRQQAVRLLARHASTVLVVGSQNSSNANRLRETAEKAGATAYLLDCADEIDFAWIDGCHALGVTAGASTPEHLVAELLARLRARGWNRIVEIGEDEDRSTFALPETGGKRDKHG